MKWLRIFLSLAGILPAIMATEFAIFGQSLMFFGAAGVYWWFVYDTIKCFRVTIK